MRDKKLRLDDNKSQVYEKYRRVVWPLKASLGTLRKEFFFKSLQTPAF
jgi:hypothetical protein